MLEENFKKEMGYRVKVQKNVEIPGVSVDMVLSMALGWSRVYHGFDGKPWKLVGIIKYNVGIAMRFQYNVAGKKVYSVQLLTEKQIKKVGEWFRRRAVTPRDREVLTSLGIQT